jgi:choline dehydrogenase
MATICRGRRVSAADAFLKPAMKRPNLHVVTHTLAQRLIFADGRAVGVVVRKNGHISEVRARREVIVSLGSLGSPKLLQLSGIGPREVLDEAGVKVYLERDNLGRRMREHRCMVVKYRLKENLGSNKQLATPAAQALTALKYLATRKGPLAAPAYDVIAFLKTRPELDRVDGQLLLGPWSVGTYQAGEGVSVERLPGVSCVGEVLRPTSEGSVWITSADPDAALQVDPNFYATDYAAGPAPTCCERCGSCSRSRRSPTGSATKPHPGRRRRPTTSWSTPRLMPATAAITPSERAAWAPATTTSSTTGCGCEVSRVYASSTARSCRR